MNRRSGYYIGIPVLAIVAIVILFVTSSDPTIQPSPIPDVYFGGASVETAKVIGGDTVSIPMEIENNDEKSFNVRVYSIILQNETMKHITIPEFIEVGDIAPNETTDATFQVNTKPVDTTKILNIDFQILADDVVSDEKEVLVTIIPDTVSLP